MKTLELINILTAIGTRYGANAFNSHVYMDAFDDVNTNYVVVEVWDNAYDVYITDDADKFMYEHCLDDDEEPIHGLKSVVIYTIVNGSIQESVKF